MKKAQIEIIGLVMVVILITIGLFFSMSFNQSSQQKTPLNVYADEELAANFLITMLETDAGVGSDKLQDIAIDCVRYNVTEKSDYENPCGLLENTIKEILEKSLVKWGHDYNLSFTYENADDFRTIFYVSSEQCVGERSAPGWQPVSLFRVVPGKAVFRLDICT